MPGSSELCGGCHPAGFQVLPYQGEQEGGIGVRVWPWGKCARLPGAAGWNGSGYSVVQAQHGQPTSDSTQGGFWNCDLLSREDRFLSRMA